MITDYLKYSIIRKMMKQWLTWLMENVMPQMLNRSLGNDGSINKKHIARGVKKFFERNYELRYNVIKRIEEFRPRRRDGRAARWDERAARPDERAARWDEKAAQICPKAWDNPVQTWQQLTDRELDLMAFEQMEQMGVAWAMDVKLYARSALVPRYNPVTDFLERCGTWDGATDHIRQMARRVPTDWAAWPDYFHRWLLAVVAQWLQLSADYGNAVVPMLIGGQGTHKSTFCRLLLPPELREYYIDDIKLDNAEQVERMLGRMLLVNIDEYNAKTEREQAKIKRVLTERDVQTRRMRSDQYEQLPRMASFIATTNDRQPLYDPTGSRRYLCCEVTGVIDTDTPIDHSLLYAQALSELRGGAQWHFSKDEERLIEQHNRPYRVQTSTEEVLTTWFEPAPRGKDNLIPAPAILTELRRQLRPVDVPSMTLLTKALKSAGFHYGAVNGQRGWYARRREQD